MAMIWIWAIAHLLAALGFLGFGIHKQALPDFYLPIFANGVMFVVVILFLLPSKAHLILLSLLNVLAAGGVLFLAGVAVNAHQEWAKLEDAKKEELNGPPTERIVSAAAAKGKEVGSQSHASRRREAIDRLAQPLADSLKRMDDARAELRAKALDPMTAQQRDTLLKKYTDAANQFHLLLLSIEKDSEKVLGIKLGPDDVRVYLEGTIARLKPLAPEEEVYLKERKILMTRLNDVLTRHKATFAAEDADLVLLHKGETKLTDLTQEEIRHRHRQLTRLYTELEEAVAARDQARGDEADMKAYLERIRLKFQELSKRNQELAAEIARREAAASK